jgi:predicted dehydrogenase
MKTYSDINVVVAGTGFIGPVHVEALKRLGVNVMGIMGSSAKKSEAARKEFGLEKSYIQFEDILEDNTVHAIHLAVPNILHYKMAKQALLAGKHILCEKPLAMTTIESEELVAIAKESEVEAGVCYNIRFYGLNIEARNKVQKGELGKVFSIVGNYVQDWLLYETDYNWRVSADQGGVLRTVADIGTHWMDLVTSISGLEIESVFADLQTFHPIRKKPKGEVETFSGEKSDKIETENITIDTEDCACILLRFKGGARASLWVSQVSAGRKNQLRYEISGSKGALAWNSDTPNELWLGHRDKANEILGKNPAFASDLSKPYMSYPGGHNEGFSDTFKQIFKSFYDRILYGGKAKGLMYPTFAEGHHEIEICEAILESHKKEKWIKV